MLDCRKDRLDYGEQLQPPPGYHLDQAVAATYSADLGALLSIPVALVYAQTMEGDLSGARFQLLKAIEEFSGRVRIYHQAGQLHVPKTLNWLYAHLEDALVPILLDDAFTAFHPKVWVIRFAPDEEEDGLDSTSPPTRFRVLVLSRNLTFDRSWDVAATLEGEVGELVQETNAPLIDFVNWLNHREPIPWGDSFVEELKRVRFDTPDGFSQHIFHPIGIPGFPLSPLDSLVSGRLVVLSPFLHRKTIERFLTKIKNVQVFSRSYELARLPVALLKQVTSYALSPLIVEGESLEASEDGSADEAKEQELHAKVFVAKSGEETSWFLGSANATEAARERNVEFLIELRGTSDRVRIHRFVKELIGVSGREGPFFEFEPEDGGKEDAEIIRQEALVRRFEYAILKAPLRAWVERSENGSNWDLFVEFDGSSIPPAEAIAAYVSPFNVKSKLDPIRLRSGEEQAFVFRNIGEVELSQFLRFRIESGEGAAHEFLLRVEIANLPAERLENILRRIIDSSDKFFEYLRFLLADEVTKEDLLATGAEEVTKSAADWDDGWHANLPIYEQLLVVASRDPRRLAEVDELIRQLAEPFEDNHDNEDPKPIIPEAFQSFWNAFRDLIPESGKEACS